VARIIRIKPFFGLGNRMLQHMMAEAIRAELPDAVLSGPGLPEWNIPPTQDQPQQGFALVLRGHSVPLTQALALSRELANVDIYLSSLSARLCYYQNHRAHYQALFPVSSQQPSAGADQLVINLRLAEILTGLHSNYMPLPINWYRDLIAQTRLSPVFMGQIGDDAYSLALRRAFPDAQFIPSMGPEQDFDFIARATHVALPISTFSWLAAWLSPMVQTIHMPVVGLYHPAARPDHDLLPLDDPRYHFHIGEMHYWRGNQQQLDALIEGPLSLFEISAAELAARFPTIGTENLGGPSRSLRGIDPATHGL